MIDKTLDELFETIETSKEYQSYLEIGRVIDKNKEVNDLMQEIKELQKKSVRLEEKGNEEYKRIDKLIDEKVKYLNSIPIYQEYLRRMKEFNSCLSESSNTIEKYINDKV